MDFDVSSVNSFYITNKGFVIKTGETTIDIIKSLNPYPGRLYESGEFIKMRVKPYVEAKLKGLYVKNGRE